MIATYFPPELRTASVVRRWSIVHTVQQDNVAQHSFYVAVYSLLIADLVSWDGDRGDLARAALLHDIRETVTGDLPSPVKTETVKSGLQHYSDAVMKDRLGTIDEGVNDLWSRKEIVSIVKAADRLDAVLFLGTELRMGNQHLRPLHDKCMDELKAVWHQLPGSVDTVARSWAVALDSIVHHHSTGGQGL